VALLRKPGRHPRRASARCSIGGRPSRGGHPVVYGEDAATRLLAFNQLVLSLQLPFAV
jgi:hypothetical protein